MPLEICQHCGQRIRPLNPHRIDRAKVRLLEQIAKKNRNGIQWVKVQRDGNLIKPHMANFTIQCDDVHALRMTWFKLLESKGKRTGKYRVTPDGLKFLAGLLSVPAEILCKDGQVVQQSALQVKVNEVRGVILDKDYWAAYRALQVPVNHEEQLTLA